MEISSFCWIIFAAAEAENAPSCEMNQNKSINSLFNNRKETLDRKIKIKLVFVFVSQATGNICQILVS